MSKNVAVFIDVANIFYAAKAAGVDIDYVQLLKTATAGRDLVRAYAYTGLDPENDNQKQFHSFLGRHGYRVVSKDIRKYGDGRVKANLDIELVVDMMRTASNLDIAVVVSGDGDFAPAIRAVQDLGVRVEVISFRANTSSDLIDVADVFTDIREIARVDKGSSRSGRRVASDEEDLSMTAVPEKESEGPARRRRGGRGRGAEREEGRREPAALSEGAGLVALPGEKLSHGAAGGRSNGTSAAEAVEATAGPTEGHEAETDGEGRRRRRRRGGRGRGRGRERGQELAEVSTGTAPEEEDEDLPDFEPPRLPASSTFGSVWDSQIGMTPPANVPGGPIDETYED
ncbi:MAG TPA: NYN domain-containing protein, partial [Candidatus Limnocylindrales bacterium]|nr:NYN domain-containing protein [Candidatus Limnocylindrales bacterium]